MPAAIAYERTGSGPPLVLVHGITESRHSWDPLTPSLAERFDVVAVDLRGHGESAKVPPFDIQRLNRSGSLFLTRPTLGHYIATRDELLTRARDIFAAITDGSTPPAFANPRITSCCDTPTRNAPLMSLLKTNRSFGSMPRQA